MLLNQIPMNLFGIFPTLMREHFFFFIYAIATLWLISIAACRRKSWGIVLWLPPFLGLAWWIIFRVLPLFSIITHASGAGPGAGFYGMGAAYALIANLPIGICWIILLLLKPRIGTPNRWTTLCAVAICPPIYVFLYLLSTETIPLRVVDQDGKGIGHCSVAYVLVSMPEKRYERSTDAEGFCRFRTIPGMGMDITSISASGYESEPNMQRSYLLPNKSPTNPMLFRMWSTNIHEELIAGNKSFKIVPDGRPYFIDLTHDTISETSMGDLKVWIQYTNNGVVGQQANWGAQVDVVNGGLLEEKDACSSMLVAPTNGYVPMFQERAAVRPGGRGETGDRRFYLAVNNGQKYGRMTIDLCASYGNLYPGLIRLSYAINPSGSRLLR